MTRNLSTTDNGPEKTGTSATRARAGGTGKEKEDHIPVNTHVLISLFASSIRPHLYPAFFNLLSTDPFIEKIEVIFAGNTPPKETYKNLTYIETKNIKPAQCYEVARRACKGEVVVWIADDCEFPDGVIGKAYTYYKTNCTNKDVVSIQTRENYGRWLVCDATYHRFFANSAKAPKMAPIGMVSREYFESLGGIDARFICGQWDNDLMMRIYNDGGKLYHFSEATIDIDHLGKHDKQYGISCERPFGKGYAHDREILEGAWGRRGKMKYEQFPFQRYDEGFIPYNGGDLLAESRSYNLKEIFSD